MTSELLVVLIAVAGIAVSAYIISLLIRIGLATPKEREDICLWLIGKK